MIVDVRAVSRIYNQKEESEFFALKDVTFQIHQEELLAIVGPSGAGKTTLFNLIGTLDTPDLGHIEIMGKLTSNMTFNEKAYLRNKTIGFIFQQFKLIPNLSALDNALLPLLVSDKSVGRAKRNEVKTLFEKYGLSNSLKKYPHQLSGGEQQRVAIIRALVNDPEIILADEPTGSLDSTMSDYVFSSLQEIHRERQKTVVYITHNKDLVDKAQRIITIRDGRIIKDETNNA